MICSITETKFLHSGSLNILAIVAGTIRINMLTARSEEDAGCGSSPLSLCTKSEQTGQVRLLPLAASQVEPFSVICLLQNLVVGLAIFHATSSIDLLGTLLLPLFRGYILETVGILRNNSWSRASVTVVPRWSLGSVLGIFTVVWDDMSRISLFVLSLCVLLSWEDEGLSKTSPFHCRAFVGSESMNKFIVNHRFCDHAAGEALFGVWVLGSPVLTLFLDSSFNSFVTGISLGKLIIFEVVW